MSGLNEVLHLLPETARTLIRLVGLTATMRLVEAWPGIKFPVSKNQRRDGAIRFEMLAEIVGVEAAETITRHFGGDVLNIPKCQDALRELQHRQIRAEFDSITREHTAVYAVTQLALQHRLADRTIWRILKQLDSTVQAEGDKQLNLF